MKKGGGMRVQSQAIIVLRLIDGYYFLINSEKILLKLGIPKKVGMEETPPSLSPPKHLICLLDMENKCCIG